MTSEKTKAVSEKTTQTAVYTMETIKIVGYLVLRSKSLEVTTSSEKLCNFSELLGGAFLRLCRNNRADRLLKTIQETWKGAEINGP